MSANYSALNASVSLDGTRFLHWISAILLGTIITLASFIILPSLNYREPENPEPIIEVEFMPWQKSPPPTETRKAEEKQPTPIKKPEPKPDPPPPVEPKPEPQPEPKPIEPEPLPVAEPEPVIEPEPKPDPEPEPVPLPTPVPEPAQPPVKETPSSPEPTQPRKETAESSKTPQEALPTPVPIFKLTATARFIRKVEPTYPQLLKNQGISGRVKLAILIDKTGQVRNIEVLESSHPEFADAAIKAINNSSFQAAESNGQRVPSRLILPVNFGLK